jgi:hypothetical protein
MHCIHTKQDTEFSDAIRNYKKQDHLFFFDMESIVLGMYASLACGFSPKMQEGRCRSA